MNLVRYLQFASHIGVASLLFTCVAAGAQSASAAPVAHTDTTSAAAVAPTRTNSPVPVAATGPIDLQTALQSLIVIGFILTYLQIRTVRRQARANVLLRMFEEWNGPELYDSVRYIHQLRRDWKTADPKQANWPAFADEWVKTNAPTTGTPAAGAWMQRRRAAQFLDKMGYMLYAKYITPDDLFAVVPEAPRLLLVLNPLERAIVCRYHKQETSSADWDRPSSKLYLEHVDKAFARWSKKTGHKLVPHDA